MSPHPLDDIEVLLGHLEFVSYNDAEVPADFAPSDDPVLDLVRLKQYDAYYESVLKDALETYLRGVGHPQTYDFRELLGEEVFCLAEQEPLLRARLLMRRTMDGDVLPSEDGWKIQIFFKHKGNRATIVPIDRVPDPHAFETNICFAYCTFTVDEGLRHLLHEGRPYMAFQNWFHGALWDDWEQEEWTNRVCWADRHAERVRKEA